MSTGDVNETGGSRQATVTVRGDALIRTEPDEALLWIGLSTLEDAPGQALADVSTRSKALVAMLEELGIAEANRSTTGVSVQEEFDYSAEGRKSPGHRASSSMAVRLSDHELLGRVIARSTEQLAAQVNGPQWQVAADNPARLEAARLASAQAARKARAYAEGVGAELGSVIRLSEPQGRVPVRAGAARMLAASGDSEPMPIEAGEHEVLASIEATFALKPLV